MGERIRVGIVGAGRNVCQRHIPGFRALENIELVSVCNRSRQSSETVARNYGIRRVYDNWRELVDAGDTQAILIGTWPYLHAPVTLRALEAGKHVLCEARMAMNAAEARDMLAVARAHPGQVAQLVPAPFTLAFDPTIRTMLDENFVGDVLSIEIYDSPGTFLNPEAPLHWRHDDVLSGCNIMSLGIWYETVMRWVGPAVRVLAAGKTFVHQRRDAEGHLRAVRIPEHVDVLADMACGAQARFTLSQVSGHMPRRCAHIFGSRGTLRLCDGRLLAGPQHATNMEEITIPESERGRWSVEDDFVRSIRCREPVRLTTFEDGVAYMEFTEAVGRSMADGHAIALPL